MSSTTHSPETRQRLLDAACEAFAQRGYEHATVREICASAALNLGAVNYHFGSKRELYAEVLRRADARPAGIEEATWDLEDPRERIRLFVQLFLQEILGRAQPTWTARVLANELAHPTGLLDELVREAIRPHFLRLRSTVAQLLGDRAGERTVDDFTFTLISQLVFYRQSRPIVERLTERAYGREDIERLSGHVFRVVMAAIEEERCRLRSEDVDRVGEMQRKTTGQQETRAEPKSQMQSPSEKGPPAS